MFVNSCGKTDAKLLKNMYSLCNFSRKIAEITTFYRTFAENFADVGIRLLSVTNRNSQIEDTETHRQLDRMELNSSIRIGVRCYPSAFLSGHHWQRDCQRHR